MAREKLLRILQWNDRHAAWTDAEADREGVERATKHEAVKAVVGIIRDAVWVASDPRGKANPRRRTRR
jgi:hypothetical protein